MGFWSSWKSSRGRVGRISSESLYSGDQGYKRLGPGSSDKFSSGNEDCLPPTNSLSRESEWVEQERSGKKRRRLVSLKRRLLHRPRWLRSEFESISGGDSEENFPLLSGIDFVYGTNISEENTSQTDNGAQIFDSRLPSSCSPLRNKFKPTSPSDFHFPQEVKETLSVKSFVTLFFSQNSNGRLPIAFFNSRNLNVGKALHTPAPFTKEKNEKTKISESSFSKLFKQAFGVFATALYKIWELINSSHLRLRNFFKDLFPRRNTQGDLSETTSLYALSKTFNSPILVSKSKKASLTFIGDFSPATKDKTVTGSLLPTFKPIWYDEYCESDITHENSISFDEGIEDIPTTANYSQDPPTQEEGTGVIILASNGTYGNGRTSAVYQKNNDFITTERLFEVIRDRRFFYPGNDSTRKVTTFAAEFAANMFPASAGGFATATATGEQDLFSLYAEECDFSAQVTGIESGHGAGTKVAPPEIETEHYVALTKAVVAYNPNVASAATNTNFSYLEANKDSEALRVVNSLDGLIIPEKLTSSVFFTNTEGPGLGLAGYESQNFAPKQLATLDFFESIFQPNTRTSPSVDADFPNFSFLEDIPSSFESDLPPVANLCFSPTEEHESERSITDGYSARAKTITSLLQDFSRGNFDVGYQVLCNSLLGNTKLNLGNLSPIIEEEEDFEIEINNPEPPLSASSISTDIGVRNEDSCTKVKNSWADYDSEDDSIYEDFFASSGNNFHLKASSRIPNNQQCLIEDPGIPSDPVIHSPQQAETQSPLPKETTIVSTGVALKNSLEDLFASIISGTTLKSSETSDGKDGSSFGLEGWNDISLDELISSELPLSPSGEIIRVGFAICTPPDKDFCFEEVKMTGLSEEVEILPSEASGSDKNSVSNLNDEDALKITDFDTSADPETFGKALENDDSVDDYRWEIFRSRDSWRKTELFLLNFEDNESITSKVKSKTVRFSDEDETEYCVRKRGNDSLNSDSNFGALTQSLAEPESLLEKICLFADFEKGNPVEVAQFLKETTDMYRSEFLGMMRDSVLPCKSKVKELVEEILSIRSSLWGFFSFGSGLDNEFRSVYEALKADKVDYEYWQEKLQPWRESITYMTTGIEKAEQDAIIIAKDFHSRFKQVSEMVTDVTATREEYLNRYDLFCETYESQPGFDPFVVHRCTHVIDFDHKTKFFYFLDLEYVQEYLEENVHSLLSCTNTMEKVVKMVLTGFASIEAILNSYQLEHPLTGCTQDPVSNFSNKEDTLNDDDDNNDDYDVCVDKKPQRKRKRNNSSRNKRRRNKNKNKNKNKR